MASADCTVPHCTLRYAKSLVRLDRTHGPPSPFWRRWLRPHADPMPPWLSSPLLSFGEVSQVRLLFLRSYAPSLPLSLPLLPYLPHGNTCCCQPLLLAQVPVFPTALRCCERVVISLDATPSSLRPTLPPALVRTTHHPLSSQGSCFSSLPHSLPLPPSQPLSFYPAPPLIPSPLLPVLILPDCPIAP